MTRPCRCDRVRAGAEYRRGTDCHLCWLWAHVPAFRSRHGGDPSECVPVTPNPCRHLTPVAHPGGTNYGRCARGFGTADGLVRTCIKAPSGCQNCKGYEPTPRWGTPPTSRELPVVRPQPTPASSPQKPTVSRRVVYGVTSCLSRLGTLLPRTLVSLTAAGFDRPHLFLDGVGPDDASGFVRSGHPVTLRWPAVRTAGNWVLSLYELYYRDPTADLYAVFQDDLVCVRGLRAYLEATPLPDRGYLNLFTVPRNHPDALRERGYPCDVPETHTGFYPSNQRGRGAVALVFPRAGVQTLLSQPHLVTRPERRSGERPDEWWPHRTIDGGVIEAMTQAGWREYVHLPSLVQHTGRGSSMGNVPQPDAPSFPGEGFDARELLGGTIPAASNV